MRPLVSFVIVNVRCIVAKDKRTAKARRAWKETVKRMVTPTTEAPKGKKDRSAYIEHLVRLAQRGDREAADRLTRECENLLHHGAIGHTLGGKGGRVRKHHKAGKGYKLQDADLDDRMQEARLALIAKALPEFDLEQGVQFTTFLFWKARAAFTEHTRQYARRTKLVALLSEVRGADVSSEGQDRDVMEATSENVGGSTEWPSLLEFMDREDEKLNVFEAIRETLSPLEQLLIYYRFWYGLRGGDIASLSANGKNSYSLPPLTSGEADRLIERAMMRIRQHLLAQQKYMEELEWALEDLYLANEKALTDFKELKQFRKKRRQKHEEPESTRQTLAKKFRLQLYGLPENT